MNKKLLPLTVFAIAVTSLFFVRPAQGFGYTETLQQVGANVVANGSGAIDLAGLGSMGTGFGPVAMQANEAYLITGTTPTASGDLYGGFIGPANFGPGGGFFADTGSGDWVGLTAAQNLILVPTGYLSNTALSSSATFDNTTLASLGVRSGTYVWTWGDGGANERFTLIIRGQGVPDGGTTVSLLGCVLLALLGLRRRLGC